MQVKDIIQELPRHPTKRYKERMLNSIRQIVVHHSATTSGTPEAFARYHVQQKWPGISYHYVIARDGTVYKCQKATTISYHASGANGSSIGVCLVGHFDEQLPTQAQTDSLIDLLADLVKAYRIKIDGVIGHREVPGTKKSCPGNNIDMADTRRKLAKMLGV
jgi:N-acetylmuramoyl-L-alanine amidase